MKAKIDVVKVEMSHSEAQRLMNAITPIATEKRPIENYVFDGLRPLYEALRDLGYKYEGD